MTPIECTCETCQGYCQNRPGMFAPGEAERAAELLGMTLAELFVQRLVVDYWVPDRSTPEPIYLLAPARVHAAAGDLAPAEPHGVCTFYREGRCQIHGAKPLECRLTDHRGELPPGVRRMIVAAWDKPELRGQLEALLGRPLSAKAELLAKLEEHLGRRTKARLLLGAG